MDIAELLSLSNSFPLKLNNFNDREFRYFRASEEVASKSNAGN